MTSNFMDNYGFQYPWRVGCGGTEVPFTRNGKRYLYVWNMAERKHYYYCFDLDIFIRDVDFNETLNPAL